MKEAILYTKLDGDRVKCHVCPFFCVIKEGERGMCKSRINKNGRLFSLIYGVVSSIHADNIEKKPLYHFAPGSITLSLGSYGCNFRCPGCQNWQISQVDPIDQCRHCDRYTPNDIIQALAKTQSKILSLTYNEPGIWLEFALDCFRLAKKQNYYTVFVTNGYISKNALEQLDGLLDAFRVDIKGFSEPTYKKITSFAAFKPVCDATVFAKQNLGMHVECITNIIPGMNDDRKELTEMAKWIKNKLGEFTPWHITAFSPNHKLYDMLATDMNTLVEIVEIGKEAGLKYIYIGNVGKHMYNNTYCHNCGKLIIEREGFLIKQYLISGGRCSFCKSIIPGRMM